jgi:hypothetical protein
MPGAEHKRFVFLAALLSLTPVVALPWATRVLGPELPWALGGWLVLAVTGVVAGGWLVSSHGKAGNGFLGALVGGMLARMVLTVAGMGAAMTVGKPAMWALAAGAVAGFLPVMVFELIWFYRASRKAAARV